MNTLFSIFVLLCLSGTKTAPSRRDSKGVRRQIPVVTLEEAPTIESQKSGGPGRTMILVNNPLDEPVWADVECPNTLTIVPIGLAARTSSRFNLAFVGGDCRIRSWRVWVDGRRSTGIHLHSSSISKRRHPKGRQ